MGGLQGTLFTILVKGKKISLSQNPQRKEEGTGSKLQGKKLRCQRTWGNRKEQGERNKEKVLRNGSRKQ
jgi:putative NADPH-quinone reductase